VAWRLSCGGEHSMSRLFWLRARAPHRPQARQSMVTMLLRLSTAVNGLATRCWGYSFALQVMTGCQLAAREMPPPWRGWWQTLLGGPIALLSGCRSKGMKG